jgi:asparagine synthase (glutamine-hydrolysing)
MCGIVGIHNAGGLSPDRRFIEAMCTRLVHRGPDEEGFHVDGFTHLGSRRLSIIDLEGGRQPIYSEEGGKCIVYNGEVYNFREIGVRLSSLGHRFRTDSDTEVVLKAYIEWGTECLQMFRGMFAFCIWDAGNRVLFAARDRLGIKPLYHTLLDDGTFLFASEIKALLCHPEVPRRVRPNAVDNLLTYGFNVAPHTFFEGIRQVLPGHYLRIENGNVKEREYWDIDLHAPMIIGDEVEIATQLRERISDSVAASLVSDVPVAAYLSGGIDSSAVVGMYTGMAPGKVITLSITFNDSDYQESAYSREVAGFFDAENIEFGCSVDPDDIMPLVYHLEDPMSTLLNLPLFMLSKKAQELGFKVVLTGDGADEILGGYDYFKLLKIMRFIGRQETGFRRNILRRVFPALPTPVHADIQYMFLQGYPLLHEAFPYRFQCYPFKSAMYSRHYREILAASEPDPPVFFDAAKISHRSLLDQSLYIESKMRLLNLTLPLADKMSMAHSVEVRPCFLDHKLVEFSFRIPTKLKMLGLDEKWILKKSMRGFLPDGVCRRKKQPLQPPGKWFLSSVEPMVDHYLSDSVIVDKGYFDPSFMKTAVTESRNGGRQEFVSAAVVALFVHLWDEIFLA